MLRRIDLTGQRFGKLVVISFSHINEHNGSVWNCVCDCGKLLSVSSNSLRNSNAKSCGCIRRKYLTESELLGSTKEKNNIRYAKVRKLFLEMYGKSCRCCGENSEEFLTIEHINGQSGKRETSYKAYSNAIREYRPDLYEVLCMNCNHAKGRYGYCPHNTS